MSNELFLLLQNVRKYNYKSGKSDTTRPNRFHKQIRLNKLKSAP